MNSAAAAKAVEEASLLPSGSPSDLPWDIVTDILSRLPVKPLMRFKCVSTSFHNLISNDPLFKEQHLNQSSMKVLSVPHQNGTPLGKVDKRVTDSCRVLSVSPDGDIQEEIIYDLRLSGRIYNSCDGLFCVGIDGGGVIIWNPSTRQWKKFPRGQRKDERGHIAYSLAHDSRSNVYKLLGVYDSGVNISLRFYSAETKTWRCVEGSPPCGKIKFGGEPAKVNGAFHWFCCCDDGEHLSMKPHVVSLDICDETYGMLAMPRAFCPSLSNLFVVKGKLCVMCEADSATSWEIWVMNEYGVADSMARMFSFSSDELERFSCHLNTLDNDELIMIYVIYIGRLRIMFGRKIEKRTVPYAFFESLVSPHTCLEKNVSSRTEIVTKYKFSAMLKKAFRSAKQVWTKPKHYLMKRL